MQKTVIFLVIYSTLHARTADELRTIALKMEDAEQLLRQAKTEEQLTELEVHRKEIEQLVKSIEDRVPPAAYKNVYHRFETLNQKMQERQRFKDASFSSKKTMIAGHKRVEWEKLIEQHYDHLYRFYDPFVQFSAVDASSDAGKNPFYTKSNPFRSKMEKEKMIEEYELTLLLFLDRTIEKVKTELFDRTINYATEGEARIARCVSFFMDDRRSASSTPRSPSAPPAQQKSFFDTTPQEHIDALKRTIEDAKSFASRHMHTIEKNVRTFLETRDEQKDSTASKFLEATQAVHSFLDDSYAPLYSILNEIVVVTFLYSFQEAQVGSYGHGARLVMQEATKDRIKKNVQLVHQLIESYIRTLQGIITTTVQKQGAPFACVYYNVIVVPFIMHGAYVQQVLALTQQSLGQDTHAVTALAYLKRCMTQYNNELSDETKQMLTSFFVKYLHTTSPSTGSQLISVLAMRRGIALMGAGTPFFKEVSLVLHNTLSVLQQKIKNGVLSHVEIIRKELLSPFGVKKEHIQRIVYYIQELYTLQPLFLCKDHFPEQLQEELTLTIQTICNAFTYLAQQVEKRASTTPSASLSVLRLYVERALFLCKYLAVQ